VLSNPRFVSFDKVPSSDTNYYVSVPFSVTYSANRFKA